MDILLQRASVFLAGGWKEADIRISGGRIHSVAEGCSVSKTENLLTVDCSGKYLLPGFADVHVHLREPGFSYKETISTGSEAALRGGYTALCTMPNLSPAPDSARTLAVQEDLIRAGAKVDVIPYGTITEERKGQKLSAMEEMAARVVGFTDDGSGIDSDELMLAAMETAKKLGKPIVAHCEVKELFHGPIHAGVYAKEHGIEGIPSECEYLQLKRDLELVERTGCRYHVCHISCKESVELLREAKKKGLPVTAETGPHYLVLCDEDLQDEGRFKMNPPIRGKEDRAALLQGLLDGTVDMIATDHAPHSAEEKSKGLRGSAMGITGLETAFPVLYTHLVKPGILPLEKLCELMSTAPRRIFGLRESEIRPGAAAELTLVDLNRNYTIEPETFASMGKATPFAGMEVYGKVVMTIHQGEILYRETDNT